MNPMNPMDFVNAIKPAELAASYAGYARSFLTELEKQAERWADYGTAQSSEATRLLRTLQTQAFGVSRSVVDTAEKAFGKTGG